MIAMLLTTHARASVLLIEHNAPGFEALAVGEDELHLRFGHADPFPVFELASYIRVNNHVKKVCTNYRPLIEEIRLFPDASTEYDGTHWTTRLPRHDAYHRVPPPLPAAYVRQSKIRCKTDFDQHLLEFVCSSRPTEPTRLSHSFMFEI